MLRGTGPRPWKGPFCVSFHVRLAEGSGMCRPGKVECRFSGCRTWGEMGLLSERFF